MLETMFRRVYEAASAPFLPQQAEYDANLPVGPLGAVVVLGESVAPTNSGGTDDDNDDTWSPPESLRFQRDSPHAPRPELECPLRHGNDNRDSKDEGYRSLIPTQHPGEDGADLSKLVERKGGNVTAQKQNQHFTVPLTAQLGEGGTRWRDVETR